MLQITLHEILTKVKNKRTKIEKIKCLRKYDTPELRSILKSSFDPNIVWLLPAGEVPYNQREFHVYIILFRVVILDLKLLNANKCLLNYLNVYMKQRLNY